MHRLLLIGASALLYAAAMPPWSVSAAPWVALVPLLAALHGVRPRSGAVLGGLWGVAAIWGIGHWVPGALAGYYEQPWWFGVAFALGISIVLGAYTAGFAACIGWMGPRLPASARVLFVAAWWVVWELARARLLTGEPWILLGYAIVPATPMIQVADLGGVYALSFLIVAVNAAGFEALLVRTHGIGRVVRRVLPAAVLLTAAYGYGIARLGTAPAAAPATQVVIVQGNDDVGTVWRQEYYGQGLTAYLERSYEAAIDLHPALIVWPESAVTFFLAHEPRFLAAIARLATATGAEVIVGGPHREGDEASNGRFFNSAFLVGRDGTLRDRYDKVHLLPFAEYFPLRTIQLLRRRFERVRSFTPGSAVRPLATQLGPVGVVICFEAIFPELVREQMAAGARVLVNLSNDAWLGSGAGPAQHLTMARLRAVEHRVWVVRAATTGISALIDPYGRVVAATDTFTPAVLRGAITPQAVPTLYKRAGDWFAYACLAGCLAAMALLAARGTSPSSRS